MNNEDSGGKRSATETRQLASRGWGRISVSILYFLGFYILLAPWIAPKILGWTLLTEAVGGEQVFLRLAVGLLFLYFATLTQEKYALKYLTRDILHAFNMLLYGQNYQQHRASVASQIQLLKSDKARTRASAHKVLMELTGQEFPAEHEPWAVWWAQARRTFKLVKGAKPSDKAPGSEADEKGENQD